MDTLSDEGGQFPLVMVQVRMVGRVVFRFVTELIGEAGLVTIPGPNKTVQRPVPVPGVLAARVAVGEQTF
jgi:hypothetical protein